MKKLSDEAGPLARMGRERSEQYLEGRINMAS